MAEVAALAVDRSFVAGDVLLYAGDEADEVSALLDGEVGGSITTAGGARRRSAREIAALSV